MSFIRVCFLFLACLSSVHAVLGQNCYSAFPPAYSTTTINMPISHFSALGNQNTFPLRVLYNLDCFMPGGPVLFYTGNEGDIQSFWANTGIIFEWAQDVHAAVVFAEHRYYGQSTPFGSNSFSGTNLAYLSIEEALADYAQVIKTLPTILPQLANAPVVAIGGSYGGVLSAWLRLKYPWAVVGAISASAPILYLNNGQLDTTFFEIATHDYTMNSPQCSANIRSGFTQFMSLYQEQDYATIAQKLRLCQQPTSPQELQHILLWLINSFLTLAQFNYPYPTNFDAALPGYPVNFACSAALNVSGAVNPEYTTDALELMGQAAGILNNGTWNNGQGTGTLTCFDPFAEFIQCADQTGCGLGPDATAWDIQVCSEFSYFPITTNITDMFPPTKWTPSDLNTYCQQKYDIEPKISWSSIEWGREAILQDATNIVFSNGQFDPFSGGGFTPSSLAKHSAFAHIELNKVNTLSAKHNGLDIYQVNGNPSIMLLYIQNGAHHLDLRATNRLDPPSVTTARDTELRAIATWTGSYNQKMEAQKMKMKHQKKEH